MNNPPVKKLLSVQDEKGNQTNFICIDHSKSPDKCEHCGKEEELRPYGPDYAWICFDCLKMDEKNAEEMFSRIMGDSKE